MAPRKRLVKKSQNPDLDGIRQRIWNIGEQLNNTFVQRSDAIKVMLLSYLSGEHYLLVGEPGTAKTAIAELFASHIEDANWFSIMLGNFTTPEKIFGPLDIQAFQAGEYKYVTRNKLPEAHIAFLDEFFKCNEGALNEMLTILNERKFDGHPIPLMTVGTATNWPEILSRTDNTKALYDRILLRCIVEDIFDKDGVVDLLEKVEEVEDYTPNEMITLDELNAAIKDVKKVEISESIRNMLFSIRERLSVRIVNRERRPGTQISSRRLGQLQKVLRAHAWLNDRDKVTLDDFEALQWGLWNDRDEYQTAKSVLETLDAEAVKEIVEMIDEGRAAYRELDSSGYGSAKVNKVLELIKDIAHKSRTRLKEPIFTESGRESIRRAMNGLKTDFESLDKRAKELLNNEDTNE